MFSIDFAANGRGDLGAIEVVDVDVGCVTRVDDLRAADVDFLTIGQYLQPTRKHAEVKRFVTPDEFKALETTALAKGFLLASASPLTRSSYHAGEDFARLKVARLATQR